MIAVLQRVSLALGSPSVAEMSKATVRLLGARQSLYQTMTLRTGTAECNASKDTFSLLHSAVAFPHPVKVKRDKMKGHCERMTGHAGEDAYVVAAGQRGVLLGVADGVHVWREHGIDSGAVSRELLAAVRRDFLRKDKAGHRDSAGDTNGNLERAWTKVIGNGVQGSTTVCLAALDQESGILHTTSLGDSACLVVRGIDGTGLPSIAFRTKAMEHSFGYPFQLGHHATTDSPTDASVSSFTVQHGDYILVATDGLVDNLDNSQIIQQLSSVKSPLSAARQLAIAAFGCAIDRRAVTPYCLAATKALNMFTEGGKPDDITVVAARVLVTS